MTALTHWKKLNNPDFIGAYAFQPGETKTLTIGKVTRENITGADGKKEECTIVYFQEKEKPLILNSTNGKMIEKVVGTPYTEEWSGKRIVLGVEKVKAFGEVVDAVRVKKQKPNQTAAKQYICADCEKPIEPTDKYAAETIAGLGVQRYGVSLCLGCATLRKSKLGEVKEAATDADNQNPNQ